MTDLETKDDSNGIEPREDDIQEDDSDSAAFADRYGFLAKEMKDIPRIARAKSLVDEISERHKETEDALIKGGYFCLGSNIIPDFLYIGSALESMNEIWLKKHRITHIMNVTADTTMYFPDAFTYVRIPVNDKPKAALYQWFASATRYIERVR
mmetsp:Transcript_21472/g.41668  ORF Transcript_21472/g.41668 Transcript_21472/m.41668 type:complete len:153 (-) Transcript_21472:524-982(-)